MHATHTLRLIWAQLGAALLLALCSLAAHAASDCFEQAGAYQGVNPTVLRAIVWFESKGDANAVHRNADGSVDIGQAQINSIHFSTLARYGVPRHALTDACVNVFVAAYHSETPAQRDSYARSIQRVLVSWGELQPR